MKRVEGWFSQLYNVEMRAGVLLTLILGLVMAFANTAYADPFPPTVGNGAAHFPPIAWPASDGDWTPYTVNGTTINDRRTVDPSTGGGVLQDYVNVSSGCPDASLPSVYYNYDAANQTILLRSRVAQIPNTYATGLSAGNFSAGDPWKSAQWTVLIDVDGDGYREFAVTLDGRSGTSGAEIDRVLSIYSDTASQSIDYPNSSNIHLLSHNPTAFVDTGTNKIRLWSSFRPNARTRQSSPGVSGQSLRRFSLKLAETMTKAQNTQLSE